MRVDCSCGKKLRVDDKLAGKKIKCPGCGSVLVAEEVAAVVAPAEEPAPVEADDPPPRDEELEQRPQEPEDDEFEDDRPRKKKKKKQKTNPLLAPGVLAAIGGSGLMFVILIVASIVLLKGENKPAATVQAKEDKPEAARSPFKRLEIPGKSNAPPVRPGLSQKPDFALTAEQLGTEYEKDRAAADLKYKGKILVIEGPILQNNTILDSFSVALKGRDGGHLVECYLSHALMGPNLARRQENLPNIVLDAKMKLQGRCKGMANDFSVGVTDCVFVN